jgi:hypothetical protein
VGAVDLHERLAVDHLFAHLLIGSLIHWAKFVAQMSQWINEPMSK